MEHTSFSHLKDEHLKDSLNEVNKKIKLFEDAKLAGYNFKLPGDLDEQSFLDIKEEILKEIRKRSLDHLI